MYKYLDIVKERPKEHLEIGKTYNIGVAHLGYIFSHYMEGEVLSKTVHNEYTISYGVRSKDNRFGYMWDKPNYSSSTRIVSAELIDNLKG